MTQELPPKPNQGQLADPSNTHESREKAIALRIQALQKYLSQIGVPEADRIDAARTWLEENAEKFEAEEEVRRETFKKYLNDVDAGPEDFVHIIESKQ